MFTKSLTALAVAGTLAVAAVALGVEPNAAPPSASARPPGMRDSGARLRFAGGHDRFPAGLVEEHLVHVLDGGGDVIVRLNRMALPLFDPRHRRIDLRRRPRF